MSYIYNQGHSNDWQVQAPLPNYGVEWTSLANPDLLMVTYGPEQPDPRNIIQLITHGTRDQPCVSDCIAKKFTLYQPIYVCLEQPPKMNSCHSLKASGRIKYTFPKPMFDQALYKIDFGWVSMLQVLQGDRSWTPEMYPIALVGVECIDVVFHASGYLPQYIRIPLICKHHSGMTFYEIAHSVSAGYRDIIAREADNISPSRTATMTPIVMNVNNLRLGSLYTEDPSKAKCDYREVSSSLCSGKAAALSRRWKSSTKVDNEPEEKTGDIWRTTSPTKNIPVTLLTNGTNPSPRSTIKVWREVGYLLEENDVNPRKKSGFGGDTYERSPKAEVGNVGGTAGKYESTTDARIRYYSLSKGPPLHG
ncbi:uncharacterized protein BT62DRAFT_1011352 [Guyanagaster necrorhizus]|uniref:Uncharacterized protein n=1 Tax=Guyanagaster necrorhizus TaxID=856835 RepID=A0A9P7VJH8_9AGAR|nr:uncharacterized protein BT62DRAFT_1011352 [Guyanagaster necrorhizus MCA 3950]KAG7441767.1 hypothetical protein BT62DRAFT_1011352 [Guyanagaster necrorhizus MCA 3950]